jgi:hypothetical protein
MSASTIASGSKPRWAKWLAAARKQVVFPVSDAPKNIVRPGRLASPKKTVFEVTCFGSRKLTTHHTKVVIVRAVHLFRPESFSFNPVLVFRNSESMKWQSLCQPFILITTKIFRSAGKNEL